MWAHYGSEEVVEVLSQYAKLLMHYGIHNKSHNEWRDVAWP